MATSCGSARIGTISRYSWRMVDSDLPAQFRCWSAHLREVAGLRPETVREAVAYPTTSGMTDNEKRLASEAMVWLRRE